MNEWMKFDQTKVTDSFHIPCGFLMYAFVFLWENFLKI